MDGNSLGLLSKDAENTLLRVLDEWKRLGINGWMNAEIPWFYYAEELAKLQAPLIGAEAEELIIHSSTTVNIHASCWLVSSGPMSGKIKFLWMN